MKIYFASFFEEENHGSGRKIGITPAKPRDLSYPCDFMHDWLSPGELYWDYHREKKFAGDDEDLLAQAGENFRTAYKQRLQDFAREVLKQKKEQSKTVFELIGLEDGDTLLSWEREGHTSYRKAASSVLEALGYEVEVR